MKIYYVRHGQTDWNLAQKMQGGESEKDLNATGIKQAQKTKQELENVKYDIIIRSPMHRAEQTADIINEDRNVEIIVDERLRERRLGEFEGHDVTEEMVRYLRPLIHGKVNVPEKDSMPYYLFLGESEWVLSE